MEFLSSTLIHKDFYYQYSLRSLFKEKFEVTNIKGQRCFMIPTDFLVKYYREHIVNVRNIDFVCPRNKPCKMHKSFLYLQHLIDTLVWSVEEKSTYYKYFYFQLKDFPEAAGVHGWTAERLQSKCLKHLSYSRRLAYLNQFFHFKNLIVYILFLVFLYKR